MTYSASLQLPPPGERSTPLLQGPATAIETLVTCPREPLRGGCVICHPHPLYGGAMSNKVVYALASTADKAGLATLRFNFRGVGRSTGLHDEGRGETEDTTWLVQQLRACLSPEAPLVLAGFSFGAFVALKAAAVARPAALMSVAPPFGKYFGHAARPPHPGCAWTVIHSRDDDTVSYQETAAELDAYRPAPHLVTVDGAGHFFHGRLADVHAAFSGLLAGLRPAGG